MYTNISIALKRSKLTFINNGESGMIFRYGLGKAPLENSTQGGMISQVQITFVRFSYENAQPSSEDKMMRLDILVIKR